MSLLVFESLSLQAPVARWLASLCFHGRFTRAPEKRSPLCNHLKHGWLFQDQHKVGNLHLQCCNVQVYNVRIPVHPSQLVLVDVPSFFCSRPSFHVPIRSRNQDQPCQLRQYALGATQDYPSHFTDGQAFTAVW